MLVVNESKCVGCACCMPYCPVEALWVWGVCQVNQEKCTECLACVEWCPVEALEVQG
ncbi:MAG: 4Fe-4S binding protein [Dehalococcoidia bacterium]|nr:4Fe-4S binding protein [Dehalococcoidia bacterium]